MRSGFVQRRISSNRSSLRCCACCVIILVVRSCFGAECVERSCAVRNNLDPIAAAEAAAAAEVAQKDEDDEEDDSLTSGWSPERKCESYPPPPPLPPEGGLGVGPARAPVHAHEHLCSDACMHSRDGWAGGQIPGHGTCLPSLRSPKALCQITYAKIEQR